jgi:outer membrane protein, heavy metal efflux system
MYPSFRLPIFSSVLCLSALFDSHPSRAADSLPSEATLASELRLQDVSAWALARNPSLSEFRQRQSASQFDSQAAGRLPDLQLKYEQWSVPLRRPWDLSQSGAVMLGVQQVLPPMGSLAARSEAERAQVQVLQQAESARRLEVVTQVEKAFAAYYQGHRQLALHQEHSGLVAKLLDLARVAYQSGVRSQQDVVRLSLEISRVHETLVHMEPELASARALLNTLMNRPVDAPLGPPAELNLAAFTPSKTSQADAAVARPEVKMAESNVKRGEAMVNEATLNANRPMVMVGLNYMYMPMDMYQHTYGAMVAMNLPWLNPGKSEEVKAAQHRLAADKEALQATRLMARYEVRDAQMRMRSAWASYEVLDGDVVLQAQRNLDTARSMYAAGQSDASALMDAARILLEVRLDRVRALAHLQEAAADLNRAESKQ